MEEPFFSIHPIPLQAAGMSPYIAQTQTLCNLRSMNKSKEKMSVYFI
jgi:hypothetical protein